MCWTVKWFDSFLSHRPGRDLMPASASPSSYKTGSELSAVHLNPRHKQQRGANIRKRTDSVKLGHLRGVYSLLSSGCVNSSPTAQSMEESIFRETGMNRDVSGVLGGGLLDETFLLQTTEPAWCCLCNKPDPNDTWQLPAVMRGLRVLIWRWSRLNNRIHRFTDIVISPLFAPSVDHL